MDSYIRIWDIPHLWDRWVGCQLFITVFYLFILYQMYSYRWSRSVRAKALPPPRFLCIFFPPTSQILEAHFPSFQIILASIYHLSDILAPFVSLITSLCRPCSHMLYSHKHNPQCKNRNLLTKTNLSIVA